MARFFISDKISLALDELEENFIRSSGPGGQNVNKVSSAVQLRFNVRQSTNLPDRVKYKMLASGDSRLTKNGVLVINAERHRTQELNRQDARERLKEIILKTSHVPKRRIATKPTRNSQKRRVDSKTKRGLLKKGRGRKVDFD
ncbi:MAG: alternative ribosome rescue aminoacyl-tRNA hydrolase ArfB [Hyphomicrobiales bacterium]